MSDAYTPIQLQYGDTFPAKIPCIIKQLRLTPIALPTQNGGFKLTIPIKNDKFWDPYSAHIKMTVDFSNSTYLANGPNPLDSQYGTQINNRVVQLDGCAAQLLSAISFTNDNDDIEAIFYQDVLANVLKDMGVGQLDKYSRLYEGIGSIQTGGMPMQFSTPMAGAAGIISSAAFKKDITYSEPNATPAINLLANPNKAGNTGPIGFANMIYNQQVSETEGYSHLWSWPLQQNLFSGYGASNPSNTSTTPLLTSIPTMILQGVGSLYNGMLNEPVKNSPGTAIDALKVKNQLSKLFTKNTAAVPNQTSPSPNGVTSIAMEGWNAKFGMPITGVARAFDKSPGSTNICASIAGPPLTTPLLPMVPIQKSYFNPTRIQHLYYKFADLGSFDNNNLRCLKGLAGFNIADGSVLEGGTTASQEIGSMDYTECQGQDVVIDDNWCQGAFIPNYTTINMLKSNSCLAPQRFSWNLNGTTLMTDYSSYNNYEYAIPGGTNAVTDMWQQVEDYGFSDPFPASTAAGCFETQFSTTIPQRLMVNGVPSIQYQTSYTYTFPLLSGVFGILMPPDKHKLIPMGGFRNLNMNAQINQFAFFTSWHGTDQNARVPQITKFELCADVADFQDDNITAALDETLQAGIVIHTESWYNCLYNTYNQLPSEIKINQGFESLKSFLLIFNATDYRYSTAARKHYRLSQNITSFQIQIGTTMFPQNAPISGNAGCNTGSLNNTQFIYNLYRVFGLHIAPHPTLINTVNYAVDFRDFDYTMCNLAQTNGDPYNINHNQWQTNFFKENRIIGKAVFGYDFDSMGYDGRMLAGVNTYEAKPFSIFLTQSSSGSSYAKGSAQMYVGSTNNFQIEALGFGLYDLIVRIGPTSAKTQGV